MSMNWLQFHQAIRREINTAVGTATARKMLVTGLSEAQEQKIFLSRGVTPAKIYINICLNDTLKLSAMLSNIIKQINGNMGRNWAILKPLPSNVNKTLTVGHVKSSLVTPKQHILYLILRFVYNIFICIQKYEFLLYISLLYL